VTFRVQPAVIARICDGCRTESDPVDCPELLDQGWTLAPGTPYDHPVTALDWCPNCTTIRSDLAAAIQRVREFCAATNPIRGELHMAALHGWDTAMEMVLQLLESGEIKGFTFRIANLEGRTDA